MRSAEPTPDNSRPYILLAFALNAIALPTVTRRGSIYSQASAIICAFRNFPCIRSLISKVSVHFCLVRRDEMSSIARRSKSAVTLALLLVAAVPVIFTGCGGGIIPAAGQQGTGPAILSVSPSSGPAAGGIKVIISGANFSFGTQQDAPAIAFGGQPATQVRVISATQVVVMTPPHAAGHVTVEVTNPAGKSASSANDFTYTSTSLAVSSVTPNSGATAGGTSVLVTGSGFASGATVSFGGTAASSVSVLSATQINATAPAHAAGAVSVAVTNPDGSQGSLPSGFTDRKSVV